MPRQLSKLCLVSGALAASLTVGTDLAGGQPPTAGSQRTVSVSSNAKPVNGSGSHASEAYTFVVGTVISAPNVVRGADHRQHLAYELQLLNTAFFPVSLTRLDTLDPATGARLATRQGSELTALVKRPEGGDFSGVLGPGLTGIVILDVSLPARARLPRRIVHRLTVSYDPAQLPPGLVSAATYLTGSTRVGDEQPVIIGRPLRGPRWVADNGCCVTRTDHRGGAVPVNGQLRLPERFAIDFVRLDQENRLFNGPISDLASYRYYGVPVLSVADGKVVRIHDGEPEQVPPNSPPPFDPETAPGNWMVVDIGDGHFVLYAHLRLHSLTAKVGQRVRRGAVIGRLGNTGSSSAPHLHLQVMDAPSPSAANGLPYEFANFTSPGTVTDANALLTGQVTPVGGQLAGTHRHELALNLQVVDFG